VTLSFALLLGRTPTQRDVTRFGVDRISTYVKVVIIDASVLIRREQEDKNDLALPHGTSRVEVHSFGDLIRVIEEDRIRILLDTFPPGKVRSELRKLLGALGIRVARHAIGPVPPLPRPSLRAQLAERAPSRWSHLAPMVRGALDRFGGYRHQPLDWYITAGDQSRQTPDAREASKLLSGRSLDCDEFERVGLKVDLPSAFCAFVDSGGPLHPDYTILGRRPITEVGSYFHELRLFLEETQQCIGQPVVVARHPRMTAVDYSEFLPGIRVVDSATAEIVRRSSLVLDTGSTATSFTVLSRKPILYISPGSRPGALDSRLATAFASALGQKVHVGLDEFKKTLRTSHQIDVNKYENYRRQYLYSDDSTGRSFGDEITRIIDTIGPHTSAQGMP